MSPEDPDQKLAAFKRTVATWLCLVPLLFSVQCILVAARAPDARMMAQEFGSKIPRLTQLAMDTWPLWIAIGIIIPGTAFLCARKGNPQTAILYTLLFGLLSFFIAQSLTAAILFPIYQLGVATGSS